MVRYFGQRSFILITGLFALLFIRGANAEEDPVFEGWVSQRIRTRAFENVKLQSNVGQLHPSSDPDYMANRQAIREKRLKLDGREITDVRKDGSYNVVYSGQKISSYQASGKTETIGYINQLGFPQKVVVYQYPSGKLKTVTFRLSPKDVYVFNATGELIQSSTETLLWERLTYEKKVAAVGMRLLTANRIKENISFVVEPNRGAVNASSTEMFNQVSISRGLLAYIENDDELAAVLSHELAHIILRHRHIYPRPTHDELLQKRFRIPVTPRRDTYEFSRAQEKELDADRMGLRMLVRAGYQPEAMVSVLQKITSDGSERDWSTHPSASHRIQAIQQQIRAILLEKSSIYAASSTVQGDTDTEIPVKMLPVNSMMIQQWTAQQARSEVLKYNFHQDLSEADWSRFPQQDPQHALHLQIIHNRVPTSDSHLLYQEATGLYAKLLEGSQRGAAQYTVKYPGTRAFIVFNIEGKAIETAFCNRAEVPRVCQLMTFPTVQVAQKLFEITETDAFILDKNNDLTGYRLQGGFYDSQGQRLAILKLYK